MKMIDEYVLLIQNTLEKIRNDIDYKLMKKHNNKLEVLLKEVDKSLLEKYRYIEYFISEELDNNDK